jgi:glucose-6-phosphate 1-dehydrogenase
MGEGISIMEHPRTVEMKFNCHEAFPVLRSYDAYETLLWEVMKNDATLFMRADQVVATSALAALLTRGRRTYTTCLPW